MDNIPEPVKRQLRAEAGFGCCKCGNPILTYHHIIERSVEEHNRPNDMMALCIEHHDMCTKHAVLELEQRQWKATPRNIQRGYVDGVLKVNQTYCIIALGSNTFVGEGVIFRINGADVLSISILEGRLALSLSLYDETNRVLLEVANNDWISGDTAVWDIWSSYQKVKIRTTSGDVRLDLDASQEPMHLKAQLMKDHKVISITRSGVFSSGPGGLNMDSTACVGATFTFDTVEGNLTINGGSQFYINQDPRERLKWCLGQLGLPAAPATQAGT